jgi:alkylation response protein AidB-like acyl-CoA dehydrogenase
MFELNEEQQMLQDSAKRFFQEKMPVAHLRKLRDNNDSIGFDKALWKEMGELGLTGTLIPETYGGTEFGAVGLCLILEEAGRTLAPSPLFSTSLIAASCLVHGGSEAQRQEILPKIAAGEITLALALEEGHHHNPDKIEAKAEKSSGDYKLTGKKTFVIDGAAADKIIFVANSGSGKTLFLLDGDKFQRTKMNFADSRNYAALTADSLEVGLDDIIGAENAGDDILNPVLDLASIGMACEMLGGVRECFERTLEHLKERKQFDEIIGKFQALKHRAAKLFCEIELSHSASRAAASAYEARTNSVPMMASLAKARLSEVSRLMTNEAVQLHGGMGMTDELDFGLFMKRARVQAQTFGDARFHRARFARLSGF